MNRVCFVLTLAAALFLPPAVRALSRAVYPLPVIVAQADAIVIARATRVPERPTLERQSADVEIVRVLKGDLPKGALTVQLNEHHWQVLPPLKADQQYILFLRSSDRDPAVREIMLDGTRPYTEEASKECEDLIALTPAWSVPADGLSTTIVPEKFRLRADEELNLFIGCRNVSGQKITLKYSDWPLATHTFWEMTIVPQGGTPIAAQKHPTLTPESINEYFSQHPHPYEVTLEPNQEFFYSVQRVNSAKPGWGYKQELDFKFYPMTAVGAYHLSARGRNLYPGKDIVANGLKIWIE